MPYYAKHYRPHHLTTISCTPNYKLFPELHWCSIWPILHLFQGSETPASGGHILAPQRNSKALKILPSVLLYQIIFLGRAFPRLAFVSGRRQYKVYFLPRKPPSYLTSGCGGGDGMRIGKTSPLFLYFMFWDFNTVWYFNKFDGHFRISTFPCCRIV